MAEKPGNDEVVEKIGCANCGSPRTAGNYCEVCGFKPKDEIAADEAKQAAAAAPKT